MGKKIVIIGTVDTKGDQLRFLKERIASRGHEAILMDISMGGDPSYEADITCQEIARLAGKDIEATSKIMQFCRIKSVRFFNPIDGFVAYVKDIFKLKNVNADDYLKNGLLVNNLQNGIQIALKYGINVVTEAAEIIAKLLTFSRKVKFEITQININELILYIINLVKHIIDKKILIVINYPNILQLRAGYGGICHLFRCTFFLISAARSSTL